MDYFFEEEQRLRFVVVDVDNPKGALNEQDFLGVLDVTLGSISTFDIIPLISYRSCVTGRKHDYEFIKRHSAAAAVDH